jgi:hypothetical protein
MTSKVAAAIRKLWDCLDYSDLIIQTRDVDVHCHRCIVFPASNRFKDLAKGLSPNEEGQIVIDIPNEPTYGVEIILVSMYEDDVAVILRDFAPQSIVRALDIAAEDRMTSFLEAAYEALLPTAEKPRDSDLVESVILGMRKSQFEDVLVRAQKLQMAWMPQLLKDPTTRARLSEKDIQTFLDTMKPKAMADEVEEGPVEDEGEFVARIPSRNLRSKKSKAPSKSAQEPPKKRARLDSWGIKVEDDDE